MKTWRWLVASFIVTVLVITSASYVLADGAPIYWFEGDITTDLSTSLSEPAVNPGARKRSNSTLAMSEGGEIALAWSNEDGNGLTIARRPAGGSWNITTMAEGVEAWYPNLAYAGSELLVTWMQGDFSGTPHGDVMQQNVGASSADTLMTDMYGYMGPRIDVGGDGSQHLIFALSDTPSWTSGDLYYTRRLSGEDWASPTAVITGSRIVENPDGFTYGEIWFPEIALSPDGSMVYFVWEQRVQTFDPEQGGSTEFQVWYAAGQWQNGNFEVREDTFEQISPSTHRAGRPDIAVDSAGKIHITWTEIQGSEQDPGEENVHYRRLDLSKHTTLTEEPVLVNADRPAWTTNVLAVHNDLVCTAWDSFPISEGAGVGKEEINLHCSRDGGETWDTFYTNASSTPALSIFPNFLIDGTGRFHVAWEEHQGGSVDENYHPTYRGGELPLLHVFLPLVVRNSG
jgi:hypothetical protein